MTSDGMDEWPTGRLLSTAARLVEHSWEAILRSQNMTHAGLISLHTIADRPASQRDIAKASRVTDQTISRTIDRLERAGYVTRETDPLDERRKRVAITESGRAIYRRLLTLEKEDAALTAAVGDVGRCANNSCSSSARWDFRPGTRPGTDRRRHTFAGRAMTTSCSFPGR